MTRPFIMGIVGGSGAGKTTLATELRACAAAAGCVVISQDRYYRGLPDGVRADEYNFDEPSALDLDLLAEHLRRLRGGETVRIPTYDFAVHRRGPGLDTVVPCAFILVEGLFLFSRRALREQFDLRLFLEVADDERLRRRVERDSRERGRCADEVAAQFTRQAEPMYRRHILPTRRFAHRVLALPGLAPEARRPVVMALWQDLLDQGGASCPQNRPASAP